MENINFLEYVSVGISLIALFTSVVMSKKNIKKMQEQLSQNIYPDIELNSKRVAIQIDSLNPIKKTHKKISIPMANIGLGSAKNFSYGFQIKFKFLEETTNDIVANNPNINFQWNNEEKMLLINSGQDSQKIKFRCQLYTLKHFVLPIKNNEDIEDFYIYKPYINLLQILLTLNPKLKRLPILHINLTYSDITNNENNKSYLLRPKIKGGDNSNKINLLFRLEKIK